MIKTNEKVLIAALAVVFLGISGVFIGAANSQSGVQPLTQVSHSDDLNEGHDQDNEAPDVAITGSTLDKASTAALTYIGQGKVTDSEVGDEEGYYEIEITLDNGSQVDVHLDENFKVLGTKYG